MTYNELKAALAAAGIGDASECRREAELLIEAFGGIKASELPFRRSENISSPALDDAVRRRIAREPLQYILGEWEFFGLDLYVTPDCLIPRPDTEITVEAAIKLLPHGVRFADLGTGSGAIAVSVLKNRPDLHCTAVDISPAALSVAQKNAARHGVDQRCSFVCADMLSEGIFDLLSCPLGAVISNPPYIPACDLTPDKIQPELEYEPRGALVGGEDGLVFYRSLIPRAAKPGVLLPCGMLIFEVGIGEARDVAAMGAAAGYSASVLHDLNGIYRTVVLTLNDEHKDTY